MAFYVLDVHTIPNRFDNLKDAVAHFEGRQPFVAEHDSQIIVQDVGRDGKKK
jgi:hypothetical protein